jgi:hypothetical protein
LKATSDNDGGKLELDIHSLNVNFENQDTTLKDIYRIDLLNTVPVLQKLKESLAKKLHDLQFLSDE